MAINYYMTLYLYTYYQNISTFVATHIIIY